MRKNTQAEKKTEKEYEREKSINCVNLKQNKTKMTVRQKAVLKGMQASNASKNPHF